MRKLGWVLLLGFYVSTAIAQEAPKGDLSKTLDAIETTKAKTQTINKQAQTISAELQAIQQKSVDLAQEIQKHEQRLTSKEQSLSVLTREEAKKRESLQAREKEIAATLATLIKLSQAPPQAILAKPGDLKELIRTAKALQITTEAIDQEVENLKQQLEEIDALQAQISDNRSAILKQRSHLASEQAALDSKLKERQKLQQSLLSTRESELRKLDTLTRKAKNLRELLETIEASRPSGSEWDAADIGLPQTKPGQKSKPSQPLPKAVSGKLRSFAGAKGGLTLPAIGRVVQRFGQKDGVNETHKGVVLETRDRAQVTALYDGEVVYSGTFLDYGRMVILRHTDNYHSLVAGLNRVDVAIGQVLLRGEPLGTMGDRAATRLYLELRQNSKPIDPAPWIDNLKRSS